MRIRFDRFVLDSATHQLLADGEDVHIGPKAFETLKLLLERRPGVVSKQDFQDRVWSGTFVSDGSLNFVITEVRRALGDAPKTPRFIRTVHGVGYAFCGEAVEVGERQPRAPLPSSRCWMTWNQQTFPLADGENTVGRDPR